MWSTTCSRSCPTMRCRSCTRREGRHARALSEHLAAWREIIPAVLRQVKDPGYHVKRRLPAPERPRRRTAAPSSPTPGPTPKAGSRFAPPPISDARMSFVSITGKKTYALYRDAAGSSLRHRRHLHPRQHPPGRRSRQGQASSSAPNTTGASISPTARPPAPPVCRGLATYPLENATAGFYLNHRPTRAAPAPARKRPTVSGW